MAEVNPEKCNACPLGPPDWRYKCNQCGREFVLPAPRGPSQEKGRVCPDCKSPDITRTDIVKSEACPPGG